MPRGVLRLSISSIEPGSKTLEIKTFLQKRILIWVETGSINQAGFLIMGETGFPRENHCKQRKNLLTGQEGPGFEPGTYLLYH